MCPPFSRGWKGAPLKCFFSQGEMSLYLQYLYETMNPTLEMELSSEIRDDFMNWRTAQSVQIFLTFLPIGIKCITKVL